MLSVVTNRLVVRNTLLNVVSQAAPMTVALIVLPWLIRGLGTERFGLLSLVLVLLGYFGFLDLGLTRATTKYVAEALGRSQDEQVPHIIWTATVTQAALGFLGGVLVAGATSLLVERALQIPAGLIPEAKWTLYLLATGIPILLISGSLFGALEARQRFDLVNAVRVPMSIMTPCLCLVGVFAGLRLPGIVLLILGARVVGLFALIALNVRLYPGLRTAQASSRLLPGLLAYGAWISVAHALGPVALYLDRFLIGAVLGVSAVAYYTAPFEVVVRLQVFTSGLIMTLFPAFSALADTREEELQRLYLRSIKYLFLTTAPLLLLLLVFAEPVIRLWLGEAFVGPSTAVFRLFLLGALIGLPAPVSNTLLQSLGRPDLLPKMYALYLPLYVAVAWISTQRLGIGGAAVAASLRCALDAVILFYLSGRRVGLRRSVLAEHGLFRCLGILGSLGALFWLASRLGGPATQISAVCVALLVFLVVVWRYVLDETDRSSLVFAATRFSRRPVSDLAALAE